MGAAASVFTVQPPARLSDSRRWWIQIWPDRDSLSMFHITGDMIVYSAKANDYFQNRFIDKNKNSLKKKRPKGMSANVVLSPTKSPNLIDVQFTII